MELEICDGCWFLLIKEKQLFIWQSPYVVEAGLELCAAQTMFEIW